MKYTEYKNYKIHIYNIKKIKIKYNLNNKNSYKKLIFKKNIDMK